MRKKLELTSKNFEVPSSESTQS